MFPELQKVLEYVFLPMVVFVAVCGSVVYAVARWFAGVRVDGLGTLITAFSLLGGVLGIAGGASRTPVMGELLPAFLTVITALLGYIFTRESMVSLRPAIPHCLIALLVTSILGMFFGAGIRGEKEDFDRKYERRLLEYKQVDLEVRKARAINELEIEKAKKMKELGLLTRVSGTFSGSKQGR